jgi:hypothetical protein
MPKMICEFSEKYKCKVNNPSCFHSVPHEEAIFKEDGSYCRKKNSCDQISEESKLRTTCKEIIEEKK